MNKDCRAQDEAPKTDFWNICASSIQNKFCKGSDQLPWRTVAEKHWNMLGVMWFVKTKIFGGFQYEQGHKHDLFWNELYKCQLGALKRADDDEAEIKIICHSKKILVQNWKTRLLKEHALSDTVLRSSDKLLNR